MKNPDVKIGMKVVPFKKTVCGWRKLRESKEWAEGRGRGFLYVARWHNDLGCWVLSARTNRNNKRKNGDFFNSSDFKPYNG